MCICICTQYVNNNQVKNTNKVKYVFMYLNENIHLYL